MADQSPESYETLHMQAEMKSASYVPKVDACAGGRTYLSDSDSDAVTDDVRGRRT